MCVRWPCAMLDAPRHLFNSSEKWKLSDSGSQGRLQRTVLINVEFIRRAIDTVDRQIGSSMQELWERPGPGSRDRQQVGPTEQKWEHFLHLSEDGGAFTAQANSSILWFPGREQRKGMGQDMWSPIPESVNAHFPRWEAWPLRVC